MQSLLLNSDWDIFVDDAGHIATTADEYATAQTAANACRLFTNDAYFDRTKGIPHFNIELGKKPDVAESVLTNRVRKACMSVEGVSDCRVIWEYDAQGRIQGGEIYITVNGQTVSISV